MVHDLDHVFQIARVMAHQLHNAAGPWSFMRVLGTPVVLLGFANPDDQAHAPNESLVLANYEGGTRTIVRYWSALADRLAPGTRP